MIKLNPRNILDEQLAPHASFNKNGFMRDYLYYVWVFNPYCYDELDLRSNNHCCELENVGLVYFLQELRYCILRVTRARSLFWLIWVYISLHFLPFLFKNYFFVFLGFLPFLCFEFDVIFLDFIYSL